jgi:exopolysaccharide biosynthesis protein
MKKILAFICLNYCFVALAVSVSAQEYRTVQDGIEHAKMTRKIKDDPVVVNLLRLDLSKVRLDVVHAMDAAIGTETTSSMATRYGAIAAINAGFFRLDRSLFAGDAVGVLQIDGKLLSESLNNRAALVINNKTNKTETDIDRLNVNNILTIGKRNFQFSGINRERKSDELIEYNAYFHRTTLTDSDGLEIIVRDGKIAEINDRQGSSRIPQNGFVISASGKMREQILPFAKIGAKVKIKINLSGSFRIPKASIERLDVNRFSYLGVEDIVSGVPQLIKDGKIEITWEQEKSSKAFVETRHPRTAVAKLKDGRFLMVTVDGRQPGVSVGMSLNELAEMLLEFGATDAMNLDGGGSTTMFLNGKIVNQPSDKEGERKVSDAILVTPRKR